MMRKKISLALLLSCLFLSLLVYVMPCSAQEQTVLIPADQFTRLKENNTKLLWKLNALENQLILLENHSSELTGQLNLARENLMKSQESLKAANGSLTSVSKSQRKTNEALKALEVQLELERQQQKDRESRLKWQRNMYIAFACYLMAK